MKKTDVKIGQKVCFRNATGGRNEHTGEIIGKVYDSTPELGYKIWRVPVKIDGKNVVKHYPIHRVLLIKDVKEGKF